MDIKAIKTKTSNRQAFPVKGFEYLHSKRQSALATTAFCCYCQSAHRVLLDLAGSVCKAWSSKKVDVFPAQVRVTAGLAAAAYPAKQDLKP